MLNIHRSTINFPDKPLAKKNFKNTSTQVPEPGNAAIKMIAEFLRSDDSVKMPASVPTQSYQDNLQILEVPVRASDGSKSLECWFNCLRAQHSGLGSTVFGWAIWKDPSSLTKKEFFIAQHHAVLRTADGLVDITPVEKGAQLSNSGNMMFIPDARVPFDCIKGRFPTSLLYKPDSAHFVWAMRSIGTDWIEVSKYGVLTSEDESWKLKIPESMREN